VIDLERVVCRVEDVQSGRVPLPSAAATWPLRGLRRIRRGEVHGYRNRCPHAGHPLDLIPGRFLTADSLLILCSSHGALFEKSTGLCVAGPCPGRRLARVPLEVRGGLVMLAAEVDLQAVEESP
jgi:nitrite reductase/ring-hydroxylating ferredoxin subunit